MKAGTPKGIKIEDRSEGDEVDLRLYKIWSKKKISTTPFLVTNSVEDFFKSYEEFAIKWQIRSADNNKILFNLADKHNKKANNYNGQGNFLKSGI